MALRQVASEEPRRTDIAQNIAEKMFLCQVEDIVSDHLKLEFSLDA